MNYESVRIENPFGSPVFHVERTGSTMNDARALEARGEADGTVVYADFQDAGRGRIEGRVWKSTACESLLCTVMLRRSPVPGFTLRVGLAVSRALDAFLPEGRKTRIKWPNDVLVDGRKIVGILCENDGDAVYVGTGINLYQREFPPEIAHRATSLAREFARRSDGSTGLTASPDTPSNHPVASPPELPTREAILARYLQNLKDCLAEGDWKERVAERLLYRGERIRFLAGDPNRRETLDGFIEGIGEAGELLFRPYETPGETAENGANRAKSLPKPDQSGLIRVWSGEIPYPESPRATGIFPLEPHGASAI